MRAPSPAPERWEPVPDQFDRVATRLAGKAALREKKGGTWNEISFAELRTRARRISRYLVAQGIEAGDRVALVCKTRSEWPVIDLGILGAGAANVPIYPSSSPDQIAFILNDCQARLVFVEDQGQLDKMVKIRAQCPNLKEVVAIQADEALTLGPGCRTLGDVEATFERRPELDAAIEARRKALGPEDLASIVYTSGTTGNPKGVMLLHRCFSHNIWASAQLVEMTEADHHLSFLPLSHVLERTVGYYVPMLHGATISYAESQEKLRDNLQEVRPTFMTSVPRLYEKIRAGILEKAEKAGGFRKSLFYWAVSVGKLRSDEIQGKKPMTVVGKFLLCIADWLVFGKIRVVTGGRLRYFLSGGAPLAPELGEFFLGAGIKVLEGYGLTETAPLLCANTPDCIRAGTVGRPVAGVEVKIAEDGEILARGANVMKGYFGNDEATREAIDEAGWFHTGDIGEFTPDGCIRITDRKKSLIVLSNGKKVAPAPIENQLLQSPLIGQAMLLGEKERFLAALVVPHHDILAHQAKEKLGISGLDREALCKDPKVHDMVLQDIKRVTKGLADFERPKKIALLPREFSEAAGELTPTLKVKRKVVMERYKDVIQDLYAGGGGEGG